MRLIVAELGKRPRYSQIPPQPLLTKFFYFALHNCYPETSTKRSMSSPRSVDASSEHEGTGIEETVDGRRIPQGHIRFLPAKKHLPRNAVRRAHGKGRIEEKIHDHPVVVISQPAEHSNDVHFHLVSFVLKCKKYY